MAKLVKMVCAAMSGPAGGFAILKMTSKNISVITILLSMTAFGTFRKLFFRERYVPEVDFGEKCPPKAGLLKGPAAPLGGSKKWPTESGSQNPNMPLVNQKCFWDGMGGDLAELVDPGKVGPKAPKAGHCHLGGPNLGV